jgi:uncharacterized protein (TIGR03435 family)
MKANLAIVVVMAMPAARGQAPAFEVTSVKFNKLPPRERHLELGCSPGGRFVSTGLGLRNAFFWAFSMRPFQVTGLPAWIDSADAFFDIEAKAAGPVSEDQCRLMVQTLLADRFKLIVRRSMQDLPAFALAIAKNGPKMHEVNPDDKPKPGGGVRMMGNPVQMPPGRDPLRGWSMAQLADMLTGQPAVDRRAVVDRTGLKGIYEINLDYSFLPGAVDRDKPDIFDAVQEQLGLKLESVKVPFDTLVVERLEKPDAN